MPLSYSKNTVVLNRLLEVLAWVFLWPRLLMLCSRRRAHDSADVVKRVLLVEPFGMGDLLSLSVMLDPLIEKFPEANILLLTKAGNEEVYAYDSRITSVYTAPVPWSKLSGKKGGAFKEWLKLFRVCQTISCLKVDIGFDTRSEIRSQILMVLCGCGQRLGFTNYLNTNLNGMGWLLSQKVPKPELMHRYDMNRRLLSDGLGLVLSPLAFPSFKPELIAERLVTSGPNVLFHVGARWEYRQWPVSCWAELGQRLTERGIDPCIVGAPQEQAILDQVCENSTLCNVVADMTRLIQLIKGCDLLVCLDSGPMHLAQTLGVPVVALFGPGDFDLWHPRGEKDRCVFYRLPCNPCLQHSCIRPADSCMQKIAVDEVYDQIVGVLEDD